MEPMTLKDLFERYVTLRNLDVKTARLYEMLLDRLRAHLGHEPTVADLDDLVISRYLRERATQSWRGKRISAASVAKDKNMIQAAWTMAARKRLAADFPELPRIKVPKSIPIGRAYTADDVQAMLRRAATRAGTTGGVPSSWWWVTLLWAAYCSGERATALMSLRWGDVDFARRTVLFRGESRKGKTRSIEREITAPLADMMRARAGQPDALVWVWDRKLGSLWTSLKLLCRLAGVKYRGFHGLRRTRASYAALAGGAAAATAVLDHSDPRLQEVYVDPTICPSDRASVSCLPPLDLGHPDEPGTVVLD